MLADVPIYAVTQAQDDVDDGPPGLVLLNEPDNENGIAYFFLSPDTAKAVYAPLKAKNQQASSSSWEVTQFSLGLVWFEFFDKSSLGGKNGIEYRLVPSAAQVAAANSMLQQMGQDKKSHDGGI